MERRTRTGRETETERVVRRRTNRTGTRFSSIIWRRQRQRIRNTTTTTSSEQQYRTRPRTRSTDPRFDQVVGRREIEPERDLEVLFDTTKNDSKQPYRTVLDPHTHRSRFSTDPRTDKSSRNSTDPRTDVPYRTRHKYRSSTDPRIRNSSSNSKQPYRHTHTY